MNNKNKIKFGVIGAGKIGAYHVRTLSKMPEVELVGICDTNHVKSQMLAWKYNSIAYKNYSDLLPQLEAAVIAVPTEFHAEVGLKAMEKGIHCLMEKPIADSEDNARRLIEMSEKTRTIFQVGHVERFNPAVIEAFKHIKKPKFIAIERLGPYDPRVAGIGVTLDLMIHDLDILLTMLGSEIESFEAVGANLISTHEDISNVRLRFKSGCMADVTASRVTMERARKMRIYQEDSYISVDFVSGRVKIYKRKEPVVKSLEDIEVIFPKIEKREPIREELYHLIDCINHSKTPVPSGEKGLKALRLVLDIVDGLKRYELSSKHPDALPSFFRSISDIGKAAKVVVEETINNAGMDKT
ncbi:MAG: Gfo/Idh/MocA family oxidoreductase [Elusimicrobia bacterium]|nr:Gfo/Idh/MocA family oxidoreductase [Elusimicrobiota bacterium]